MKKKYIKLNQVIMKLDGSSFSEREFEKFIDSFLDLVEHFNLASGGSAICTDEEKEDLGVSNAQEE